MDFGFMNGNIVLDNDRGVYYSGQLLSGNINFRLEYPQNISAINIEFLGVAKVLWSEEEKETRNGRSMKTIVDYKAQEQYFNNIQCLVGGQGVTPLNAGPHSIPFRFQIPPTAPSTFKGDYGQVDYEIRAFMDFSDVQVAREELFKLFEVVAPLDLNKEDPSIRQPMKLCFEEMVGCGCFCNSSPVTIEVGVPVTGYCPGQVIPVSILARNDSSVEVNSILLQIICKKRYRSQRPVAENTSPEQVVAARRLGAVPARAQRSLTCELRAPALVAPYLARCSIMDVDYLFRVTINLSGCNENLVDSFPLTIGLIPLADFTNDEYVHPMAHSLPAGPVPDIPLVSQSEASVNSAYPGSNPYPTNTPYPSSGPGFIQPGFVLPRPDSPGYAVRNGYPQGNSGYPHPGNTGYPQPTTYVPQQYPANGTIPMVPVNYTPSAPSM